MEQAFCRKHELEPMVEFNETQFWYVIFAGAQGRAWWHWFTGRRFAHVYLMREVPGGVLEVNPLRFGVTVVHHDGNAASVILPRIQSATAALGLVINYAKREDAIGRGLYSCVSIVKAVLALRRCWAFTPWQLYKHLLINHKPEVMKAYAPYITDIYHNQAG